MQLFNADSITLKTNSVHENYVFPNSFHGKSASLKQAENLQA